MILPIAERADTSVAWDKYVSMAHAKQARDLPIAVIKPLIHPMILPIADNAKTSAAWDKYVCMAHAKQAQDLPIVTDIPFQAF